MSSQRITTKVLVSSAILVALAVVLGQIRLFTMPQGGEVTAFSMLPIVLCGYFFGIRAGVMAGVCVGMITLLLFGYVIHPAQLVLDYPVAFGALGLSGWLRKQKYGLISGYGFGVICRFACAVLSGVIFFGAYAPPGSNVLLYSIVYNGSYLGVEGIITMVVLAIPQVRRTFQQLRDRYA